MCIVAVFSLIWNSPGFGGRGMIKISTAKDFHLI